MVITIRLVKPLKDLVITYEGELLECSATHRLIHARWMRDVLDVGYVLFEPGDHLYEYFYTDRWYNVYQMYAVDGQLKGWYCNITRPARFDTCSIESEDLELDVFVSPDRQTILVLDEDEFAMRKLDIHDPIAYQAALSALDEVQTLVNQGVSPFVGEGKEEQR